MRGDTSDFERLGASGEPAAVAPLIRALEDADRDVQSAAAKALGKVGDARAIEPLIAMLGDSDSGLRCAAAQALAILGQAKWAGWVRGDTSDFERLGASGEPAAVALLITVLGDPRGEVRRAAAAMLGEIGDARAIPALIDVLGVSDEAERRAAAKALARLGEPVWSSMIKGRDTDWARLFVCDDPRAASALIRALGHPLWAIRWRAAEALLVLAKRAPQHLADRWTEVLLKVRAPHHDSHSDTGYKSSDCEYSDHSDRGIGLDFPEPPPNMGRGAHAVQITCPNPQCRKRLRVPVGAAGRRGKCPSCGQVFALPAGEGGVDSTGEDVPTDF